MKLAKVPFHLVQQGLTRQPIFKGAALEWRTTFIRMTGNTVHYLSITSKVSTLKKKRKEKKMLYRYFNSLKSQKESQTNKYVTDIKAQQKQQHDGTALTGVQPVQWWKRGWKKIWGCHKLDHYNLVFPLQRRTGCWAVCGPSREQLLSFVFHYSVTIFIYDNVVFVLVLQSKS